MTTSTFLTTQSGEIYKVIDNPSSFDFDPKSKQALEEEKRVKNGKLTPKTIYQKVILEHVGIKKRFTIEEQFLKDHRGYFLKLDAKNLSPMAKRKVEEFVEEFKVAEAEEKAGEAEEKAGKFFDRIIVGRVSCLA